MSNKPERTPAVPLKRPGRLRPSWLRRLAPVVVVAGLCVVSIGIIAYVRRGHACAAAVHDKQPTAAQVCRDEFKRTQDPATGVLLMKALQSDSDLAAARRIATGLLNTPVRSDALQIIGIAAREQDDDDAIALPALEEARILHRIEQRPERLARDDGVLAMVLTDRSEFAGALRLIDECIAEAPLADTALQAYCHLAAAKTLIRVGFWAAADQEFAAATRLATGDVALSDIEYQRGSYAQDSGDHESAIGRFEQAIKQRNRPQASPWLLNTELNLAYSHGELNHMEDAQRHLENARLLEPNHKMSPKDAWVAAQIAYRQHDLTRASALTDDYVSLVSPDDSADRDERIDLATLRTRIELEQGDLAGAERWARRGIELAEGVRGAQATLELRSWVLSKRRAPYELLFTALARSHQTEDAVMAFDDWQGRTVYDALARPRPPASVDYRSVADQLTKLSTWLPAASKAPFARSADRDAVLRTMRGIDLLALIVANGEVWSLTANHGPPRITRLGSLAEIQERVNDFSSHPTTEVKLAADLGALLLPDAAFRETREALHVIIDGQLAGLSVAALRHGATALIERRPIVRVLRLPETRCAHVTRSRAATVLAVPGKDLPDAQREAEEVAALLHTTPEIGPAATKAALFAAASNGVLHVAAHGKVGAYGAALLLGDGGELSALEILAHQRAPSLVVLSACNAATSTTEDLELAGSLAAGFLGAGSQHVVATLGSVTDPGAREIATRFYRAGGVTDPPRALAAVQAALAKTRDNIDWPYFTVFGPDVCLGDAPDPP